MMRPVEATPTTATAAARAAPAILVVEDDPAVGGAVVRQLRRAGFEVELDARTLEVAGTRVHMTPSELALLGYLVERPGRAVARGDLMQTLSDGEEASPRNVDTHVARVRKKLGPAAAAIVTVWGHGYR